MGLRILHTADWHLDAPFSGFSGAQREQLRRELRKIPGKIAEQARLQACDLILIAGDVFDGPYSRESLDAFRTAMEQAAVPVLVSPGNHDFCGPGSPWLEERFPENVHIFTGGLDSVLLPELDCRIYGAGYQSMDCPALLEAFRAAGDARWQIAVIHADPTGAASAYCPVTAAQVRGSGLDYLALGHIHQAGSFTAGNTLCAWPGCPMGRGFDETGEKGVYIAELCEQPQLQWVPLRAPVFFDLEVSDDALETVLPPVPTGDVYRVTLTGSGTKDMVELTDRFAYIPNLFIRDRRQEPLDIWANAGEDTLEGTYFALLREKAQADDPEQAALALYAAEISRKILEGREVVL